MNIKYEYANKHKHIGSYIREEIIPANLSITDAARKLDIGRPALSNLLNGNAALSDRMALKLEKVFNTSASELLEMRAMYSEKKVRLLENNTNVQEYLPVYHQITAYQINMWADNKDARDQLPALLRTLILSTGGTNITEIDFPAFGNSERPGWDGQVTSNRPTPWIPVDKSRWEFSCSQDFKSKADKDYKKRTKSISFKDRRTMTFVLVTPRNWTNKNKWIEEKNASRAWEEVRVYDSSDLEQWLECSISAQIRFCEFQGILDQAKVETLSQIWQEWSNITDPQLPKSLFDSSIKQFQNQIENWLKAPPGKPFVIEAHSPSEALAFLSCALEQIGELYPSYYEQTIVVRSAEAFNKLTKVSSKQIVVLAYNEIEKAVAFLHKSNHIFIVRGQNTPLKDANINLSLLSQAGFRKALLDIKFDNAQIERLEKESARSPTILRRRLAISGDVSTPKWAKDLNFARTMIPMLLVGMWDSSVKADKDILNYLSNSKYEHLEHSFDDLKLRDESPVWSMTIYRGVVAKLDALYSVNWAFRNDDLVKFLFVAEFVLSDQDPASKLPKDERWLASIISFSREHSSILRQGILDTLVMLAVHGNHCVGERLAIDLKDNIDNLVDRLLNISSSKPNWLAQMNDLPNYAEAAPDKFLEIIENDIESDEPSISALFESQNFGIFSNCPRAGLLWALELLAWKPEFLIRVTAILAKLSTLKIEDNYANTPMDSIKAIFRCWMPQTSASLEQRIKCLDWLSKEHPDVVWQICVDQFSTGVAGRKYGKYSQKPNWRSYANNAYDFASSGESRQFQHHAIETALNWPVHNEHTLGNLIEHLEGFNADQSNRLWNLIRDWNENSPANDEKAALRNRIRQFVPNLRNKSSDFVEVGNESARQIYELLKPQDLVIRHQWLFLNHWTRIPVEDLEDIQHEGIEGRENRVACKRIKALKEIWYQIGLEGIKKLCQSVESAQVVGTYMAKIYSGIQEATYFIQNFIQEKSYHHQIYDYCVISFLSQINSQDRNAIFIELLSRSDFSEHDRIRLLHCAPFDHDTLQHVNQMSENLRRQYWEEMNPRLRQPDAPIIATLVDQLIKVKRADIAFHAIEIYWNLIDSPRLIRLLRALANNNENYPLQRLDEYSISEALDILAKRHDTSQEDLAEIEFLYFDVLYHSEYGIPNIEEQLSKSPELFVRALALVVRRQNGQEDQGFWIRPNIANNIKSKMATRMYMLLTSASRVPGTQSDGSIDSEELMKWLKQVRILTKDFNQVEFGDKMIGQLLSHCSTGDDGMWPCRPVREAIDNICSQNIALGMLSGVHDSHGASWAGEAGTKEKDLAVQYKSWSQEIAFEYPFTALMLDQIADSFEKDARWLKYQNSVEQRFND